MRNVVTPQLRGELCVFRTSSGFWCRVGDNGDVGGADSDGDEPAVERMRAGLQAWLRRQSRGGHAWREKSPGVLLSLLCAATFAPLIAFVGVTGVAGVAGLGVLSSVGAGALAPVLTGALDRLRSRASEHSPGQADIEDQIAREIEGALAAEARRPKRCGSRFSVLGKIDAGGVVLQAAMEEDSERIRSDVIAAIGELVSDFAEMEFLITGVTHAAAEIQESLDQQGADVRAIMEQNNRQSADIRLVRDRVEVIAGRVGVREFPPAGGGKEESGWVYGCPYRGLLPFGRPTRRCSTDGNG